MFLTLTEIKFTWPLKHLPIQRKKKKLLLNANLGFSGL